MRKAILLFIILTAVACKKDNGLQPSLGDNVLHYDGSNISAPLLVRGISYAAIKFDADFVQNSSSESKILREIQFFVDQLPTRLKVLVFRYNLSNPTEPGNLLYERELNDVSSGQWNAHVLTSSVAVPGDGLWIAFEIDAGNQDLRVIGCDAGPRYDLGHGDIYGVFGDDNPGWTYLYNFSDQAVNINWNIRGLLD